MGKMKEQLLEEEEQLEPTQEQDEKAEDSKEVLTDVTTIKEEEEKTGKKINVPTQEELVANASMNMIRGKKELSLILPKLGKKAMQRIILAGLDLPAKGMPVKLVSKEEKYLFGVIQNMISSRFLIMQHHISQELKKQKEDNSCKETNNSTHSEQAGSTKTPKENSSQSKQTESETKSSS